MSFVYLPPWSTRAIAGIAFGLLLLAAMRWWRERRGRLVLLLRVGIISLLVFVMVNPHSILPRERTDKPKLGILLDSSASMATSDVGSDSRFSAALRTLTNAAVLQGLNKEFVLDFRRFDRAAHPIDPLQIGTNGPNGDASDIGNA